VSKEQPLKPVYLLTGTDRPKIRRALERLRARFADGAVEVLSAQGARGEDAVAACNAMGLFGEGGRLVVVEDVEAWKADDASALAAYLADPAPASVLALLGEGVRKDSALVKACTKHGDVLSYEVTKRDLPRWVGEQFARLGAQADAGASRALIDLVGDDLVALATEAEKLAAWAGGEAIDAQAVELLAAPLASAPLFAVTDAWGGRDGAALLAACELALERSPDPPSSTIPRVVGTLTHHVGRVAKAQQLAEQGVRPGDATKELGDSRRPVHRFVAEKAFAHARNYSREELEDALVRLAVLDLALKGNSRLPARLELERALVELI
jgi:DNA polymerase-3 subunit delta